MEWSALGFHTFNVLASIGAYLFLSNGGDLDNRHPSSELLDLPTLGLNSVAQSLVSDDLSTAQDTWEEVLKDVSLNRSQIHESLRYIIVRLESYLLQDEEILCSNLILVTLLKFIRQATSQASSPLSHKAQLHARVLQVIESTSNSSNETYYDNLEGVYVVTKSAADQGIEHIPFMRLNSTEVLTLRQMIPVPFWLLATERNVVIQSVRYESFLYVGREGSGAPLQLFLWNQKHLTNRNQAIFSLLSQEDQQISPSDTCNGRPNFLLYQPMMTRIVMSQCCFKSESKQDELHRQDISSLLAKPFSDKDKNNCDVTWNVQFINFNGDFRLLIQSNCLNGALMALPPRNNFTSRSHVQISILPHNQLNDDSIWKFSLH